MFGCAAALAARAADRQRAPSAGIAQDALRPRRQRNRQRLAGGDAVAGLAHAALKSDFPDAASRRRPLELAVGGQRHVLARGGSVVPPFRRPFFRPGRRCNSGQRCRTRRGRSGSSRRGARIGHNAQRIRRQRYRKRLPAGDRVVGVGHDPLHAQLRIVAADHAAGETVGISVIALDPHLHAVLLAFLDGDLEELHILGRKILGLLAAAVDHIAAAAVGVDLLDVRADPLPAGREPKGPMDGAVFPRRLGKRGGRLADRRHGDLLPRPLCHERRRQDDQHA